MEPDYLCKLPISNQVMFWDTGGQDFNMSFLGGQNSICKKTKWMKYHPSPIQSLQVGKNWTGSQTLVFLGVLGQFPKQEPLQFFFSCAHMKEKSGTNSFSGKMDHHRSYMHTWVWDAIQCGFQKPWGNSIQGEDELEALLG